MDKALGRISIYSTLQEVHFSKTGIVLLGKLSSMVAIFAIKYFFIV